MLLNQKIKNQNRIQLLCYQKSINESLCIICKIIDGFQQLSDLHFDMDIGFFYKTV